VEDF